MAKEILIHDLSNNHDELSKAMAYDRHIGRPTPMLVVGSQLNAVRYSPEVESYLQRHKIHYEVLTPTAPIF